ncbi:MAG: hypothetical protein Q7V63_04230 [Gammaproteobacteria bacterium]|nr:hypothetical protein [Gammaproteobacteria bacterium]
MQSQPSALLASDDPIAPLPATHQSILVTERSVASLSKGDPIPHQNLTEAGSGYNTIPAIATSSSRMAPTDGVAVRAVPVSYDHHPLTENRQPLLADDTAVQVPTVLPRSFTAAELDADILAKRNRRKLIASIIAIVLIGAIIGAVVWILGQPRKYPWLKLNDLTPSGTSIENGEGSIGPAAVVTSANLAADVSDFYLLFEGKVSSGLTCELNAGGQTLPIIYRESCALKITGSTSVASINTDIEAVLHDAYIACTGSGSVSVRIYAGTFSCNTASCGDVEAIGDTSFILYSGLHTKPVRTATTLEHS